MIVSLWKTVLFYRIESFALQDECVLKLHFMGIFDEPLTKTNADRTQSSYWWCHDIKFVYN